MWADGLHFNVRLDEDRLCCLVVIVASAPTAPRSWSPSPTATASRPSRWADLLRDCSRRGMRAPVLAVGDGALGFWAALRDVFPETRDAALLGAQGRQRPRRLPKSAQPAARKALAEIRDAEDREHAERRSQAFAADYGAKWPKAVAKIVDDLDALLAFFDFPAEHWIHLKTTNPIESTFATVRLRTKVTKGAGLAGRRAGDGVQAHRGRPATAGAPSTAPTSSPSSEPAPSSRRGCSSSGQTSRDQGRRVINRTRRSTTLDH